MPQVNLHRTRPHLTSYLPNKSSCQSTLCSWRDLWTDGMLMLPLVLGAGQILASRMGLWVDRTWWETQEDPGCGRLARCIMKRVYMTSSLCFAVQHATHWCQVHLGHSGHCSTPLFPSMSMPTPNGPDLDDNINQDTVQLPTSLLYWL